MRVGHKIVQVEVAHYERCGLAVRLVQQRLIPLKVAHHLLKARALVEAVRPERLHLLLRNFVRRPFHAPALGPRVAQLGYLAVQDQPVAVVGNAQAVGGLAVGGGGKVGADPGGQPCTSVRALGQRRQFSVPSAASTQ